MARTSSPTLSRRAASAPSWRGLPPSVIPNTTPCFPASRSQIQRQAHRLAMSARRFSGRHPGNGATADRIPGTLRSDPGQLGSRRAEPRRRHHQCQSADPGGEPGVYQQIDSDGVARAVVLRPDGSFATPSNPARRGETVVAYVTRTGDQPFRAWARFIASARLGRQCARHSRRRNGGARACR